LKEGVILEQFDLAFLMIRIWLGVVMIAHGVNHGRTLEGTANWFASKGFRSAPMNARVSAIGEILMGLALIGGLLTSFAVAGLIATMFVAFWSIHRFAGFFNFHRPDEGFEYVTTLAVVAAALAIAGPGRYSLDHVFDIADQFDGVIGGIVAAAGLLAGGVQVAIFWRKPGREDAE
jgi:putative oxidoreductase